MTESDLLFLKSQVNKLVGIETTDGEHLVAKILWVFDGEDNEDVFYELVSSSKPELYENSDAGGYSKLLTKIKSVSPVSYI